MSPESTANQGAQVLRGVGVGRGGVVGPVVKVLPVPYVSADAALLVDGLPAGRYTARRKVEEAFFVVADRLRHQAERSAATRSNVASVLLATAELADDRALLSEVLGRIGAGDQPVAAIDGVIDGFATMFEQSGADLADRVPQLYAVRDRVVAQVMGLPAPGVPDLVEPAVVVAQDLTLTDTTTLNLDNVLAIVTELGGPTGHIAVLAAQLGVPCVVQVAGATGIPDGATVTVDAAAGTVALGEREGVQEDFARRREAAIALQGDREPGATADGVPVALLANIGALADAARLAENPVEGVGLFRTENLYLERTVAPTLAEQVDVYSRVLRTMGDRRVVVRMLDAGGDKSLAFLNRSVAESSALGVRGYRLVQTNPELFDTQFAALAQAAAQTGREIDVMAPMIATADEARDFAVRARSFGLTRVGVMVEIPAAALRARELLAEVDFVSLGTNDLAQYTMAGDRLLGDLAGLLDPWQPAVLDLVAATAAAGTVLGKPAGVCGESAADPLMALVLVGLGVRSLSMSAVAVPAVRFSLRHHTLERTEVIAQAALGATSAIDAREAALNLVAPEVRDALAL